VVFGVLLAIALASAYRVLEPQFRVSRITVRGNHRLSAGEVLALVDGLKGQPLLRIDLPHWRARLTSSPWVADARMRRLLPGTLEIVVLERRPMATARLKGDLFLVDERGEVIDEYGPQYADLDMPIIDGLQLSSERGAPGDGPRAELTAQLLSALTQRPDLWQRLSQIDVSDPRDAVVMLKQDGTRVRLGHDGFVERLNSYLDLAPALLARVPEIDYVDLRFGPRVFVRPAGETRKTGRAER
jgi:cell division protein FtsQ